MGGVISSVVEAGTLGAVDLAAPGEEAAATGLRAAELQAGGQEAALQYMKEREALPQQFREAGLSQLAGIYGLPGGTGSQQQMIQQAMASPLYQQQISGIEQIIPQQEEALARTQSMTGGLRSGATIGGIASLAQEREALKNQALTQAYGQQLQGVQGMAGLPSSTGQIAEMMMAPSATRAQGMIGAEQSRQMQEQNIMNLGVGSLAAVFSDIRLKDNITHLGEKNGHQWFEWDWCDEAKDFGLEGKSEGVMAHLIYETNPDAISTQFGLLMVDYTKLGLEEAA